MKKMKKLFCAALAAAMLMATMSGCGSSQNRLEKIKEILESDLSSPDEILYLMLSFRFIDLENEEENRSGSSQPEKHR